MACKGRLHRVLTRRHPPVMKGLAQGAPQLRLAVNRTMLVRRYGPQCTAQACERAREGDGAGGPP